MAGSDQLIHLVGAQKRIKIKCFFGHKSSIRDICFGPCRTILSVADDGNWKLWDIQSGQETLFSKNAHKDSIRSCCWLNETLFVTGGFDHQLKIWDVRLHGKCVKSFLLNDHILKILPLQNSFVTASGSDIIITDLRADHPQFKLKMHKKGVMGLCTNQTCTRILSGGLDHSVKVFDTKRYDLIHQMNIKNPIMDLKLTNDGHHLALALSNGTLLIKSFRGELNTKDKIKKSKDFKNFFIKKKQLKTFNEKPKPGSRDWFIRGNKTKSSEIDIFIKLKKKRKFSNYDKLLRKFEYRQALKIVLKENNPIQITSLLEELWKRNGIEKALNGCEHGFFIILLKYLTKFLDDPRVNTVVLHVLGIITGHFINSFIFTTELDKEWYLLNNKLESEILYQRRILKLQGMCKVLITQKKIRIKSNSKIINL